MKILSIDFDYIMYPCIKLYNTYCSGDENPTIAWNNIESLLEIDKYLNYDAIALHMITMKILNNVKKGAKFIPITNHQEIVDYLKDNELLSTEDKITLFNIDHHHDILYSEETEPIIYEDKYTCANWVYYLINKGFIDTYTWIKAPNSDNFNAGLISTEENELIRIGGMSNIPAVDEDFDMVFFCFSPQWVPYKYEHLFQLLSDMFLSIGE